MSANQIPAIREATGAFCRSILDAILPSVRTTARFHGYAVAVHGSLKRDIDLVAVAWTDQAIPADELAEAIRGAVAGVLGNCLIRGGGKDKPHGRRAYTLIHPGFAGEIDLSVMPPLATPQAVDGAEPPRTAPTGCTACHDESDCSSIDVCRAVDEVYPQAVDGKREDSADAR